ncbi:response regulator [Mucilaginibacter daejeonensis]|uniref:response regulator n=1 Tax=Mucilaginibacter daejeonensis TaxID=398049 RepID=UPI001D1761D6|nr:response regulator [Mucilaginibacter daejeonensis]UEG51460.1 response regulator [Mucilaginibacter daejeonensis]
MFKRVLIAEDHQMTSISLRKIIKDFSETDADYVYDCDDAYARIQIGLRNENPYDLLVTDLSFVDEGNSSTIKDGRELIQKTRALQPVIKVLIFSGEHKPEMIRPLFNELQINGYVCKGRQDSQELTDALKKVEEGRIYMPSQLSGSLKKGPVYQFTAYDLILITLLSKGVRQKEIPTYLEGMSVRPSSLSSVEKKLNVMREALGFTNNEQLVACCKDAGLL